MTAEEIQNIILNHNSKLYKNILAHKYVDITAFKYAVCEWLTDNLSVLSVDVVIAVNGVIDEFHQLYAGSIRLYYDNLMSSKNQVEKMAYDVLINHPSSPINEKDAYEMICNKRIDHVIKYILREQGNPHVIIQPFNGSVTKSVDIIYDTEGDEYLVYRDLMLIMESYNDLYHDTEFPMVNKMWASIGELDIINDYETIKNYRDGEYSGMDLIAVMYGGYALHNFVMVNPYLKNDIYVKDTHNYLDKTYEFYIKSNGWKVTIDDPYAVGYLLSVADYPTIEDEGIDTANHFLYEQYLRAIKDEFCNVPSVFTQEIHNAFWNTYKNDITKIANVGDSWFTSYIYIVKTPTGKEETYSVGIVFNEVFYKTVKIVGVVFSRIYSNDLSLFEKSVVLGNKKIGCSYDCGYEISNGIEENTYQLVTHYYEDGVGKADILSYLQALTFIYNTGNNTGVKWHVID